MKSLVNYGDSDDSNENEVKKIEKVENNQNQTQIKAQNVENVNGNKRKIDYSSLPFMNSIKQLKQNNLKDDLNEANQDEPIILLKNIKSEVNKPDQSQNKQKPAIQKLNKVLRLPSPKNKVIDFSEQKKEKQEQSIFIKKGNSKVVFENDLFDELNEDSLDEEQKLLKKQEIENQKKWDQNDGIFMKKNQQNIQSQKNNEIQDDSEINEILAKNNNKSNFFDPKNLIQINQNEINDFDFKSHFEKNRTRLEIRQQESQLINFDSKSNKKNQLNKMANQALMDDENILQSKQEQTMNMKKIRARYGF